jgi:hypothetical protein
MPIVTSRRRVQTRAVGRQSHRTCRRTVEPWRTNHDDVSVIATTMYARRFQGGRTSVNRWPDDVGCDERSDSSRLQRGKSPVRTRRDCARLSSGRSREVSSLAPSLIASLLSRSENRPSRCSTAFQRLIARGGVHDCYSIQRWCDTGASSVDLRAP